VREGALLRLTRYNKQPRKGALAIQIGALGIGLRNLPCGQTAQRATYTIAASMSASPPTSALRRASRGA
jgi:hypothetical protein